jgi:hypothetical protein
MVERITGIFKNDFLFSSDSVSKKLDKIVFKTIKLRTIELKFRKKACTGELNKYQIHV